MVVFPTIQSTKIQLRVARILPGPPQNQLRLPRPDDPTPRKPPLTLPQARTSLSRHKSSGSIAANLGSGVRLGGKKADDAQHDDQIALFKVPDIPSKNGKGKQRADPEPDVFAEAVENKGKRKRVEDPGESEMEKANKTVTSSSQNIALPLTAISTSQIIKQSTIHHLSVPKSHPEYKDIYNWVYRGVGFALVRCCSLSLSTSHINLAVHLQRSGMKRTAVDLKAVDRLVKMHVNMYADGDGSGGGEGKGKGRGKRDNKHDYSA